MPGPISIGGILDILGARCWGDRRPRSVAAQAADLRPTDRRRLAVTINQILAGHGVPVVATGLSDGPPDDEADAGADDRADHRAGAGA